ncbi:hypothetical protein [Mycolicibacterium sp.]|uniref:hypothetical protein n=1 Tax=Mycolicibacterium sp. TaxID=2320850 RepID=UPI00355E59D3
MTETVDAEEGGQAQTITEAKVERKSAWAQVREQRAERRAERAAAKSDSGDSE